ncbi:hypothetical protein AVEN_217186-1 [Araneus ventricosus]|uniref:Uncharacterized protein n=1 Tax=Araneus ventricosus TaxID=182803 RepID=A0A4Y2KQF0_ARAVE|nr:hypothetical protein AVEN_217186-1 [Araneus ventricosus]
MNAKPITPDSGDLTTNLVTLVTKMKVQENARIMTLSLLISAIRRIFEKIPCDVTPCRKARQHKDYFRMDLVNLDSGQMTKTKPESPPLLQTSVPHQSENA